jgi:hypothetical protein
MSDEGRIVLTMRPAVAIAELEKLKEEAASANFGVDDLDSWRPRVRAVLSQAFGPARDAVERFDKISYRPSVYVEGMPGSAYTRAFESGRSKATGLIGGAIYELRLVGGDEPVDNHAFDPDLWAHVKTQVEDQDWGKVASLTAIFVENHVRIWAGHPKDRNGNELVGKNLYLEVFGETSDYRLGRQAGEREGWRFLGMGFAQALSNVDRHRIQKRDDAKRYALGVLGLGSLLLTQMRYEHGDILKSDDS